MTGGPGATGVRLSGWLWLAGAIASEVLATSVLGATRGFTRPVPAVVVVVGYAASFYLLSRALPTVPVGVAYAVWSGVGTAAIVLIGVVLLGEAMTTLKALGVLLVVAGVVLLNAGGGRR